MRVGWALGFGCSFALFAVALRYIGGLESPVFFMGIPAVAIASGAAVKRVIA